MQRLLDYFPEEYSPRDQQEDVIKQIQEAIAAGEKYIIIQSPTGTGKSMFSSTLSNASRDLDPHFISLLDRHLLFAMDKYGQFEYAEDVMKNCSSGGAMTLTVSKQLQSQYVKLFNNSHIMKGRSNYTCGVDESCDAEVAPCLVTAKLRTKCEDEKICPYLNARDELLRNKFGVLNYSMYMCLPQHTKQRQFLICDEASELEDEIVAHFSLSIEYDKLYKYNGIKMGKLYNDDQKSALNWITDLGSKLKGKIEAESANTKFKGKLSTADLSAISKLKKMKHLFEKVKRVLEGWNEAEYIIEFDAKGVSFTPLYVNHLSSSLFDNAETVILMSATIIDHKTFAKTLGIKKYKYIEADSTFSPSKSPIYCPGKYNLNYANIDKNLPKVAEQAMLVCEHYKGKNGIVHTHNFKITEAIKKKAGRDQRFLFRDGRITNEHILEEHFLREDGTVLVSPSLTHGTDLIGDHGQFQVIMKMPFLPLGSKRIKTLCDKDKDWYAMKMLINLVQMAGRCTRTREDKCDTFILDGQAVSILKRNWQKLPKSFRDRIMGFILCLFFISFI